MTKKYHQHPLSAAFPAMTAVDFESLTGDIKANGQRDAIIAIGQDILDGWHRYSACLKIGIDPLIEQFVGTDPRAFVLSRNLHRRHLNGSQRAAAIVACGNWRPVGRPENPEPGSGFIADAMSEHDMAAEAQVSDRTIRHAKVAMAAGLNKPVSDGTITAKRAAEIANLPESERAAAISDPKIGKKPIKSAKPAAAKVQKELERAHAANAELADKVEALSDAVQEVVNLEAENTKLRALVAGESETERLIDNLIKQIDVLEIENARITRSRDEAMNENAQLKRQIRGMQMKMDRAA